MQEGQRCSACSTRVPASIFSLFLYGIYEMSATFKPSLCILGGDNIKLHKYMPNTREATTSNAAVIKLVIKAENKGAS